MQGSSADSVPGPTAAVPSSPVATETPRPARKAAAKPESRASAKATVPPDPELTADQAAALKLIEDAYRPGDLFLLTGHAGSGKTYLMQRLTKNMLKQRRSIVLTAPTHKAVAVLARKLADAGINGVSCRTTHSLLGLRPKPKADRLMFERDRNAKPVLEDVVVVDECSMVSEDLLRHIKRHLPNAFVVFVGDPAQLPPVGEKESLTFKTKGTAHLTTIVRQAAGNPILDAATIIRTSQGQQTDWSWLAQAAIEGGHGVFLPGEAAQRWMRKAFTSEEFDADPDSFRYLAWTNHRVHEVNEMIRRWRYGDNIPTPFMPGESCLFKEPLIIEERTIFGNNQEAKVIDIERSTYTYKIPEADDVKDWIASVPSWKLTMLDSEGVEQQVHMPADNTEYQKVIARIKDEAAEDRVRWKHMHDFKQSMADLQSIYALTVHRSQGSTFGTAMIDLPDIRRRERDNLLEAQQMLYVAVTRPSKRLIVIR